MPNAQGQGFQQACLSFVLQTEKEIAPWKKHIPISTQDFSAYVAVKFVIKVQGAGGMHQQSRLQARHQAHSSFVQVWASQETKIAKVKGIVEGQH